jgi:hypothetical protein
MFKTKYTVSFLNSKWNVLKNNIKVHSLPRKDEYVFFNGLYYEVLNVVHTIDNNHIIYVIINEVPHQHKPTK